MHILNALDLSLIFLEYLTRQSDIFIFPIICLSKPIAIDVCLVSIPTKSPVNQGFYLTVTVCYNN